MTAYAQLDAWVDAHFDEQVRFLQALVRQPTDTPPGDNTPHAELTAQLLQGMGLPVEKHAVPPGDVQARGLQSITNLVVRRPYSAPGPTIALNAHGDVVPPGEGWTHDPYGAAIEDGRLYGRAAAVSKSDFATYTFALRAFESLRARSRGTLELHFTYDEELGGELGPGWLLARGIVRPDFVIAAGFSYEVINAHNGCLQLQVSVQGRMAHAAIAHTGVDALQGAVALLNALYAQNERHLRICSHIPGISHPYLNVGTIEGGTHTNVVPGRVVFKLDRRIIPEEDPAQVEADVRALIADTSRGHPGLQVDVQRLLLAQPLRPTAAQQPLVQALQRQAQAVLGEAVAVRGTPLYTDVRLYAQHGAAGVLYGAGPRTVLESNAKRADEHLVLNDLRLATRVVARTLYDLLAADA